MIIFIYAAPTHAAGAEQQAFLSGDNVLSIRSASRAVAEMAKTQVLHSFVTLPQLNVTLFGDSHLEA